MPIEFKTLTGATITILVSRVYLVKAKDGRFWVFPCAPDEPSWEVDAATFSEIRDCLLAESRDDGWAFCGAR